MSSIMNNIETSTLIHIGVDVAVVAGVSYWLNKKINNLQDKIDELSEQINHHEAVISKQNEVISRHENILNEILSQQPRVQQPRVQQPRVQQPRVQQPRVQTREIVVNKETQGPVIEVESDDPIASELAQLNSEDFCDLESGECNLKQEDKKK